MLPRCPRKGSRWPISHGPPSRINILPTSLFPKWNRDNKIANCLALTWRHSNKGSRTATLYKAQHDSSPWSTVSVLRWWPSSKPTLKPQQVLSRQAFNRHQTSKNTSNYYAFISKLFSELKEYALFVDTIKDVQCDSCSCWWGCTMYFMFMLLGVYNVLHVYVVDVHIIMFYPRFIHFLYVSCDSYNAHI